MKIGELEELEAKKAKVQAELLKAKAASPEVLLAAELAQVEVELDQAKKIEEQKAVERAKVDIQKLEADANKLREELFDQAEGMVKKADDMLGKYYRMKAVVEDHQDQLSLHRLRASVGAISQVSRYLSSIQKNYDDIVRFGKG